MIRLPALDRLLAEPSVAAVIQSAAGPVYLVGGCVRDLILDRAIHDVDILIPFDPDGTAERAAKAIGVRPVPMGRPPLMIYRLPGDPFLDLAPLTEPNVEADLRRRDLTVNALAIEIEPGGSGVRLLDLCGGQADLAAKIARFVSEKNVLDDPLRLLRLFRFASTLNLSPDPDSLDITVRRAKSIRTIAGERIREELLKLLDVPNAWPMMAGMLRTGLLEAVMPELTPLRGCGQSGYHHLDVLGHTLAAFEKLEDILARPAAWSHHGEALSAYLETPGIRPMLKLAVLWHDLGKPATRTETEEGKIHFYHHEKAGLELIDGLARRLKLSTAEGEFIGRIVCHHLRPFLLQEAETEGRLSDRAVFRLSRDLGDDLPGLLIHALADAAASEGPERERQGGLTAVMDFMDRLLDIAMAQKATLRRLPPLVNGRDLMDAFGLPPSPLIGRILRAVEEAQATGRASSREEALATAQKVMVDGPTDED